MKKIKFICYLIFSSFILLGIFGCKLGFFYEVNFIVDENVYATFNTTGKEVISMPKDPVKEGYTFEGWYWDKDVWLRPFTAESFVETPLKEDLNVYAYFLSVDAPRGTDLEFSSELEVECNGSSFYIWVSNDTDVFEFNQYVNVEYRATWTLSYDINGNNTIASKTVSLNIGNNQFYIQVTDNYTNTLKQYDVIVRRRPMYTITFNTNGGSSCATQRVEEGSYAYEPSTTRTGYTFMGWDYDFSNPITYSMEINALWSANTYTITYNPNGGYLSSTIQYISYDEYLILDTPSRTGYTFLGWYDGNEEYQNGTWKTTSDINLTAHWSANTYKISYSLAGGSVDYIPSTYTYSTITNIPNPTNVGYTFLGWSVNGSSDYVTDYVISETTYGDILLEAMWKANEYKVTYNVNGGDGLTNTSVMVKYNSTLTLPTPTKVGHTFEGWYDGNTKYYSGIWKANYNVELTARWSVNTYTISYNLNGGSVLETNPTSYTYGSTHSIINPSKVGHTFVGWSVNGGSVYVTNYVITDTTYDNLSLVAVWDVNKYTITYDVNGGNELAEETKTVSYGDTITLPTPTKVGYTFLGWYEGDSNVVLTKYIYTRDIELKAKWQAKTTNVKLYDKEYIDSFQVSFDLNGGSGNIPPQTVTSIFKLEYPPIPTRDGYAFSGWYINSNGTGSPYDFSAPVTQNITLYAKWVAMSTTTHTREYFDAFYYSDSSYKKTVTASSYSDYNLYYFTCHKTGSYTVYETWVQGDFYFELINITTNTQINKCNLYSSNTSNTVTFTANAGDVICIRTIRYSSSYNTTSNGKFYVTGTNYPAAGGKALRTPSNTKVLTYDESYSVDVPVKTGYTFLGYFDSEAEDGIKYIDSDGNSINPWNKEDEEFNLYAKWQINTYHITFDADGGELEENTIDVIYNSEFTLPTPAKVGHEFKGWYYEDSLFTLDVYSLTSSITLVAKWEVNVYTITYKLNSGSISNATPRNYTYGNESFVSNPTKVGHTFLGWSINGGSEYVTDYVISDTTIGDLTLEAIWKVNSYTITYDVNGGTPLSNLKEEVEYNSILTLPTPTRAGYTFNGWYKDTEEFTLTKYNLTTNITLTAKWTVITYTISYTLNGGTNSSFNPKTYNYETATITLSNPSRTGYTFLGWTTSGVTTPTINLTINKNSTGNKSFTANWQAKTSNVTLDVNGGNSVSPSTLTITYGSSYSLPTPSRVGYTFDGWYNGSTKVTSSTWNYYSNITLTAKWTLITYTISYSLTGGTNNSLNPTSYNYETDTITLGDPTRTGYTFLGWTTSGVTTPTKNLTITKNSTGDKGFTANWQVNSYTITYDVNGGNPLTNTVQTINYNASLTLPTPVRVGYTFDGWYKGSSKFTSTTYTYTTSITLVAKWTIKTTTVSLYIDDIPTLSYEVSFNLNGGSGSISSQTVTETNPLTYPGVPTRSGYSFKGWYTSTTASTPFDFSSKISSDITLYARWETMTYSYYSREFVDIALYNSSTKTKSFSTSSSSTSTSAHYYYFTTYNSGSYTFTTNHLSGSYYLYLFNVTRNVQICGESLIGSGTNKSISISADAGDVFYVKFYAYTRPVTSGSGIFYVSGGAYPDAGGTALNNYFQKTNVTYGSDYKFNVPSKTGYTFLGWYGEVDNDATQYTGANGNCIKLWDKEDKDIKLCAKWQVNTYTLTLDVNGGDPLEESQKSVTYASSFSLPTPTRVGYTFAGWTYNGSSVSSGTWKYATDATFVASWTAKTNTKYVVYHYTENLDGSFTLYEKMNRTGTSDTYTSGVRYGMTGFKTPDAQSVLIKADGSTEIYYYYYRYYYTVTFVTNGGSVVNPISVKYGSSIPSTKVSTKEGYTFGGWYSDTLLTTPLTSVTKNITVYAKWNEEASPSELTYTVSNNEVTITASTFSGTELIIPEYIGGNPVTTIGSEAFKNLTNVTLVVVPDSVTSIGKGAFKGLSSLEEITLPFIGDSNKSSANGDENMYPFGYIFGSSSYTNSYGITQYFKTTKASETSWNTNNTSYYIPSSLKIVNVTLQSVIPYGGFSNCRYIEEINTPTNGTMIETRTFYNCENLVRLNSSVDGFNISPNVTKINNEAFYNCKKMVSFNSDTLYEMLIPAVCTKLGENVFYNVNLIKYVTVPNSVVDMEKYIFSYMTSLEELTIPFIPGDDTDTIGIGYLFTVNSNGVTGMQQGGASGSSYKVPSTLTKINITNTTTIPNYAFYNMSNLIEVNIPTTTNVIGSCAFYNCKSLSKLNSTNSNVFNIPSGVIDIKNYSFYTCSMVEEVNLSNSVTNIGDYAFYSCNNITKFNSNVMYEMNIPSSCLTIGELSFGYLGNIKKLIISDSVTNIKSSAFRGFSLLEEITLPFVGSANKSSANGDENMYPFGYIFGGSSYTNSYGITQYFKTTKASETSWNTNNTSYYIPSSLKVVNVTLQSVIPYGGFSNCRYIEEINTPTNGTMIETRTFYNCENLVRLNSSVDGFNISPNVTKIGTEAFYDCESMVSLNSTKPYEILIPSSCTKIGENAFYNVNLIKYLTVPNSVVDMEKYIFSYMTSLEELTIPFIPGDDTDTVGIGYLFTVNSNSVTGMQQGGGSSNSYKVPSTLTKINITNTTTIPNYAFYNMSNLIEVNIPTTTNVIGSYAFYNCKSLSKLNSTSEAVFNIPQPVTAINNYSFYNCDYLAEIYMPNTITKIGNYAFAGSSNIVKFNSTKPFDMQIPLSCESIGEYAFSEVNLIKYITVPNSVTSMSNYLFNRMTSLVELTIPFIPGDDTDTIGIGCLFTSSSDSVTGMQQGGANSSYYKVPKTLTKISVTNTISIPSYAFYNMSNILEVNIPTEAITIGSNAFYKCSSLSKVNSTVEGVVNIPSGVTSISSYSFAECPMIREVYLPSFIESIGTSAFQNCTNIVKFNSDNSYQLVVPDTCESIGDNAFKGLKQIKYVTIPNSVNTLGAQVFAEMISLETLTIPFVYSNSSNIGIGYYFSNSSSAITGMIQGGASSSHYKVPATLTTVYVTKETNIKNYAFYNMKNLTTIYLRIDAIAQTNAFNQCSATVNYVLPNPLLTEDRVSWDGVTVATSYESGTGVSTNPYIISNTGEFLYFIQEVNGGNKYTNKYFKLTNDLNLYDYNIPVISCFDGHFDGNGHIIKNVNLINDEESFGLFGLVDFNACISNLGILLSTSVINDDESINSYLVGGLTANNKGVITNCYVKGSLTFNVTNACYVGGIAGKNSGTILHSYSDVVIDSSSVLGACYAGGIAGYNEGGNIQKCLAIGDIKSKGFTIAYSYVGGIVGYSTNECIDDCYLLDTQKLTRYDTTYTTIASYETVIGVSSIKETLSNIWDINVWNFNTKHPTLIKK